MSLGVREASQGRQEQFKCDDPKGEASPEASIPPERAVGKDKEGKWHMAEGDVMGNCNVWLEPYQQ